MEETQKSIQILLMAQTKETSLAEGGGSSPMMDNLARHVERSLPLKEEM